MARHPLFVLVGPTGAGKSELTKRLLQSVAGLRRVRSCTTRPRRVDKGEAEDAYHFLSREDFERQVADGLFVESDALAGNLYGRRYEDFDLLRESYCLADMTEQGVLALQALPEQFRVICIKIMPVNKTKTDRDEERAAEDAARAKLPIRVDYVVKNDHAHPEGLWHATRELTHIIDEVLHPEG